MMHKTFEELRVTGQLPSPPSVVMRILKMSQDDSHSAEDISAAIMTDSALTGRLLKLANSASAASSVPVTTISEATMRLGVRSVMNVALGLSLVSANRTGKCDAFDYDRYWSDALARAVAVQHIGRNMRGVQPAEAYVLGLLCQIGRLAFASIYPLEYGAILKNVDARSSHELARLEQQHFAIDHSEVGACMLREWGLPERYADAVQTFERIDTAEQTVDRDTIPMARALFCAHALTSACLEHETAAGQDPVSTSERLENVRKMLGMPTEAFADMCSAISREWIEWGKVLDVPTGKMETPSEIQARAAAAPGNSVESLAPAPATDAPRPLCVLAVDDDEISLKLLVHTLTKAGHEVHAATNGDAALKITLEKSPQVVIADWMMPGMDGLELCKALRRIEYGRNVFFFLLTGRADEDRIVEAFDAGVDDYIVKPFNPRVLMARFKAGQRVIQLQERVASDRKMILKQVSELGQMTRKLRAASLTDVLTELPNRRHAMKRLEADWAASIRTGSPLSVIMIDIDHFKKVNDTYGHGVGDVVLKETARALGSTTRQGEEVSRLGGEEFFVVCPNSTEAQTAVCAERLRAAVELNVIKSDGFDGHVTISLGVAQRLEGMPNFDALMKFADEAVYGAKVAGRNRVVLASSCLRKAKSA